MLLHCLYLHIFRENQEDKRMWNLACDIAVEQIITREKLHSLKIPENEVRRKVLQRLGGQADSAEKICRKLKEEAFHSG